MKSKKNPNADLNKNSSLYFAIGLAVVLLLTWQGIEFRSYEKVYGYEALNVASEDDEEIPITEIIKTPPPPPPPAAPTIIEIVEDEAEEEETIIETTEIDEETIVEDVEVEDFMDEVPFAIIEDKPIFPGCEKVKKEEKSACFEKQIQKHIRRYFRYPEIAQEMGIQGRVYVSFIINSNGIVEGIRMRGPDKNLEQEAKRIISKLPKMIPGKQRGKAVRVPYSIPIVFRLQ